MSPDPSVPLQNARCPSDEVELDFHWDEPPSAESPWRLGARTGKVPSAKTVPPTFDVVLKDAGDRRIQVVRVIAAATGIGVQEAKVIVDGAPKPVWETVGRKEAESLKADLEDVGGKAEVRLAGTSGPVP